MSGKMSDKLSKARDKREAMRKDVKAKSIDISQLENAKCDLEQIKYLIMCNRVELSSCRWWELKSKSNLEESYSDLLEEMMVVILKIKGIINK